MMCLWNDKRQYTPKLKAVVVSYPRSRPCPTPSPPRHNGWDITIIHINSSTVFRYSLRARMSTCFAVTSLPKLSERCMKLTKSCICSDTVDDVVYIIITDLHMRTNTFGYWFWREELSTIVQQRYLYLIYLWTQLRYKCFLHCMNILACLLMFNNKLQNQKWTNAIFRVDNISQYTTMQLYIRWLITWLHDLRYIRKLL